MLLHSFTPCEVPGVGLVSPTSLLVHCRMHFLRTWCRIGISHLLVVDLQDLLSQAIWMHCGPDECLAGWEVSARSIQIVFTV